MTPTLMQGLRSRARGGRVLTTLVALLALSAVLFAAQEYSASPSAAAPSTAASPLSSGGAAGFPEVAKAVTPAVVNITPAPGVRGRELRDPSDVPPGSMEEFFGSRGRPHGPGPRGPFTPNEPRGSGVGSGVIVSPDGYILTNNHVVDGASEVAVTLPDKREFKGKTVGRDPKTDLAVVKIDAHDLPYVRWGDSSTLQVGEYVLAVGNPFGLNSTVTLGIVSALGRGHMGITQYEDFIQTDAAINPGNSGGALVNTRGELVGINTAIFSQTGGYQGVGFAVPATMAKPVAESLIKTGKVVRGYLGVAIQELTPSLVKSFGLKEPNGALVSDVTEESPAERSGLQQGDVIISFQGSPITDPATLQRAVTRTPVGTKAVLTVIRNGHEKELTVTIGEQPDSVKVASAGETDGEHALAGLEVQNLDAKTARELGLLGKTRGVVVVNVEPGSTGGRAGLTEGDVIREINRKPINSVRDFEKVSSGIKKDESVLLLINRRGASLFLTLRA